MVGLLAPKGLVGFDLSNEFRKSRQKLKTFFSLNLTKPAFLLFPLELLEN